MSSSLDAKHLYKLLNIAVIFHDFGKFNDEFQNAIKTGSNQIIRHEIYSLSGIEHLNLNDSDIDQILFAVLTHHKSIDELVGRYSYSLKNEFQEIYKTNQIPGYITDKFIISFSETLQVIGLSIDTMIQNGKSKSKYPFIDYLHKIMKKIEFEDDLIKRTYIYLRGIVQSADHLASSGIFSIKDNLNNLSSIILKEIPSPYLFQVEVSKTKNDLIVTAPTGSGKTEASLLKYDDTIPDGSRIFYVLPYTASINAMNSRLGTLFGSDNVGMLHSKAAYYLYKNMLENNFSDNETSEAEKKARELSNQMKKLFKPLKILTAQQILKAFFGVKGWERNLSEFSGGYFIFDEFHAYDPATTAQILTAIRILKNYECKFLFITATFPEFLKNELIRVLPGIEQISYFDYPGIDRIDIPRHHIIKIDGNIFDNLDLIKNKIETNGKVLIVCNQVDTSTKIFNKLKKYNPTLLHGRFTLEDREKIESGILENPPDLLIATQIIEVSLNISYRIMFTEPAPLDPLFQRFGRVNRYGELEFPAKIFLLDKPVKNYLPYSKDLVEKSKDIIGKNIILEENKIQGMINELYGEGYTGDDRDVFERVKEYFYRLYEELKPGFDSESEENYFEQFEIINVIPDQFFSDYKFHIEQKEYFEAMKYKVNISKRQYYRLMKEEKLILCDNMLVAKCKYDNNIGLIFDKKAEP